MGLSSYCRRLIGGSSSSITSRVSSFQTRFKHSNISAQDVSSDRPLRQFVSGKGKSAGRNSAGRITIFHRGGGAKRSLRTIDLKRSSSSIGVVERIEYDPNRTSRIAVVRWEEGANTDHHKKASTVEKLTPTRKLIPTLTTSGQFSLSSLPGMLESRNVVHAAPKGDHVLVGLPKGIAHRSKNPFTTKATSVGTQMTSVNDVFLSAFSSTKVKGDNAPYSFVNSLGLPRMAIAGARPDFFVPTSKEDDKEASLSLDEINRWDKDSIVWTHKMKRKAAVSWHSFRGVTSQNKSNLNLKPAEKEKRTGTFAVDRAPVTYILATHGMEAGHMVMNCNPSKRSNKELPHRY